MVALTLFVAVSPADAGYGARVMRVFNRPKNSNRVAKIHFSALARGWRGIRRVVSHAIPQAAPHVPLNPRATVHLNRQDKVVLNSVPTEGRTSVVLLSHHMIDTPERLTKLIKDSQDAYRYGGPRVIGKTEPGQRRVRAAKGKLSDNAVMVEDLGDHVIPFKRWGEVTMPKQNVREILDQAWEVWLRHAWFSDVALLEETPGRKGHYRLRFQDTIGWQPNPRTGDRWMSRAEFDTWVKEETGLGSNSFEPKSQSGVDRTAKPRDQSHGTPRAPAAIPR